jgi:hypothetical protein
LPQFFDKQQISDCPDLTNPLSKERSMRIKEEAKQKNSNLCDYLTPAKKE